MGFFDRIMRGIDYKKGQPSSFEDRDSAFEGVQSGGKQFSGVQSGYRPETSARDFLMFAPASYDDVEIIIDHLKNQQAVIINLKEVKPQIAQRILDFISGAIYSLDGSIQPIENGLFLLAPGGFNIMKKKG